MMGIDKSKHVQVSLDWLRTHECRFETYYITTATKFLTFVEHDSCFTDGKGNWWTIVHSKENPMSTLEYIATHQCTAYWYHNNIRNPIKHKILTNGNGYYGYPIQKDYPHDVRYNLGDENTVLELCPVDEMRRSAPINKIL